MLLQQDGDRYRGEAGSLPANGFLLNRLRHYPHPLAFTDVDLEAWLRWARQFKQEHIAEVEQISKTGTRMVVPLRTRTEIVGIVAVGGTNRT